MQTLIASLIVVACSVYAAWTLMPAAARRTVATRLLELPLPRALAASMQRAATVASGCGCDGCDHASAKAQVAATTPQVVTFHPRPRR